MQANRFNKLMKSFFVAIVFVAVGAAFGFCNETTSTKESVKQKRLERPAIVVFTGGEWCFWCKRLETEVLNTYQFERWSEGFTKVRVKFDADGSTDEKVMKNRYLMWLYQNHVESFPTVVFIDVDGNVLAKTGFVDGGPQKWIAKAEKLLDESVAQQKTKAAN